MVSRVFNLLLWCLALIYGHCFLGGDIEASGALAFRQLSPVQEKHARLKQSFYSGSKKSLALSYMNGNLKNSFRHSNTSTPFSFRKSHRDKQKKRDVIRVTQSVNGLPIFGSDVGVHVDDSNQIIHVFGQVYDFSLDNQPKISQDDALSKAHIWLESSESPTISELSVYMLRGEPVLTWHFVFESVTARSEWHIFIDALSGKQVKKFNNVPHGLERSIYDEDQNYDLVLSEGGSSSDPQVQTVYDHLGTTYTYFLDTFGRDSYDDQGSALRAVVHYGDSYVAASWFSTNVMVFGDGDGVVSGPLGDALDIVAHEYGHGVTQYTADLIYADQSGALNESMSDFWGVMIDRENWMIGEDAWLESEALRYMDNPSLGEQPKHMDDYLYTNSDDGGVHTNSGIPNYACYLISDDSGYGIGRADTEQIYYRALTVYFTQSTDFAQARLALEQSAIDLFGINSPQFQAVSSAYDAVGIAAPESEFLKTPFNVIGTRIVDEIILSWINPTDIYFENVEIRRSTMNISSISDGDLVSENVTDISYTDPNPDNSDYYYAVFAKDSVGNSSLPGVVYVEADTLAPSMPEAVQWVVGEGDLTLSWMNPTESDFDSLMIRRSTSRYPASTTEGDLLVENETGSSYTDSDIEPNITYYYSIFSRDTLGNISEPANVEGGLFLTLSQLVLGPNPVNWNKTDLTIQYHLTKEANVSVYIYALNGELLWKKQVVAGELGGQYGDQALKWDGIDRFGNQVANGMYQVYVFAEDGYTKAKKAKRLGVLR